VGGTAGLENSFWLRKRAQPSKTVDVGEIFVAAEDGKILHRDLHIDRID
jgi:hypothetical protein